MLAQTTPALIAPAILKIAAALLGPDARRRPYGVLFAFSIASSGVRKVRTERTGPKISSWAIRWLCETPVKSVGAEKKPRVGQLAVGLEDLRALFDAESTSSWILASWSRELMAPTSVFLSSGSPTRSVREARLELVESGSCDATPARSSREPAQQTWPWLK